MKLTVWGRGQCAVCALVLLAGASMPAAGDVFSMGNDSKGNPEKSLDFVQVGNPNVADDHGYGAVSYAYGIGKYDVTVAQYCEFLNSVLKGGNYYNLYPSNSGITRTGTAGNYLYTVSSTANGTWANLPASNITWGNAARFCNWLQNGQPQQALTGTPGQDAGVTEGGAYSLNGVVDNAGLQLVRRNARPQYAIPNANEWTKAAYYDPTKPGGAGFWNYPWTSADAPIAEDPAGGTHSVNSYTGTAIPRLTDVGAYLNTKSYYGTFDQAGNVWQWTEEILSGSPDYRILRGGGWNTSTFYMGAASTAWGTHRAWAAATGPTGSGWLNCRRRNRPRSRCWRLPESACFAGGEGTRS